MYANFQSMLIQTEKVENIYHNLDSNFLCYLLKPHNCIETNNKLKHGQGRRKVWKSGGPHSTWVGIMCPLVDLGLTV